MKKCTWGIVGLVCAACTATAVAVAVRVRDLIPEGKGVTENPCGDGMAKLKLFVDPVNGPSTRVHLHLHHFQANTTYGVVVETDTGFADIASVVTTNCGGNGNVQFDFPSPAGGPTLATILVYIDDNADNSYTPDDGGTPSVNEDEIRAFGTEGL